MSIRICNDDFADVAGLRYTAYYMNVDEIKSVFKKIYVFTTALLIWRTVHKNPVSDI